MEIFPLDRQEQREPFWKRYYLNSCFYTTKKWLRQIIIFCKIKFVSYHSTTSERRTMGDIFMDVDLLPLPCEMIPKTTPLHFSHFENFRRR